MAQKLRIRCKNNNKSQYFDLGTTIFDIFQQMKVEMSHKPLCAIVNNRLEGLKFRIFGSKQVEFLDYTSFHGRKTYVRSLFFVLWKAVEELFPGASLEIEAPVSKGYYFLINHGHPVTTEDVERLRKRMKDIISADIPFQHIEELTEEAIRTFRKRGAESKARLLESIGTLYTYYYRLDKTIDNYFGPLVPSTGYLKLFDLCPYADGVILRVPDEQHPDQLCPMVEQKKMLTIFQEDHKYQRLIKLNTVGDLNMAIQKGYASQLIQLSEAIQEKRISNISDDIARRGGVKLVLIAGPSSSGKTTFSKRLSVQLMTNGIRPFPISLDDYFVDREHTPRDENGEYDYESIHALDLAYFNLQLGQLLNGEEVELPRFNFQTGQRVASGKKVRIDNSTALVLEGIHALNPLLTESIPKEKKYKIYVSALTSIKMDDHNYIPTTDNRLLRRIVRDSKYRGYSAEETIARWPSVRKGEDKWIFPYQEEADAMFNSALMFELAVLKKQAVEILERVAERSSQHVIAAELLRFLRYFVTLPADELPPTSLLREFLGGSSFRY